MSGYHITSFRMAANQYEMINAENLWRNLNCFV